MFSNKVGILPIQVIFVSTPYKIQTYHSSDFKGGNINPFSGRRWGKWKAKSWRITKIHPHMAVSFDINISTLILKEITT